VRFVVKKWVVGWKDNKISVFSVVKYSGVELCGLCGLGFLTKTVLLTVMDD